MQPQRTVRNARALWGALALALATVPVACGSSPNEPTTISLLNWWSAGGEANALHELLTRFEVLHPAQTVVELPQPSSTRVREVLRDRLGSGDPPDIFQANGGWGLLTWVLYNNVDDYESKLEAIDVWANGQGWPEHVPGPVLETVSFNHHLYGVPLNVHRLNAMFYNVRVFYDAGVQPPTTLDEMFAAAEVFKTRGVTPIAVGRSDPWTLALMLFENIFVARSDGTTYREFFHGRGDAFSPAMQQSVSDLSRVLSYANDDAATSTWTDALDKVATGKAAMTIMGDWAKAFLEFRGAKPDVDFGQIPMPGTAGTFVFTTDTFGSPKGAANHRGALDVLELFASTEGQDLFNPIKGSISARDDTDVSAYDRMAQETITAFREAAQDDARLIPATAILCPPEYTTRIVQAVAAFVDVVVPPQPLALGNPSFLLHTLDNWSDLLRKSPLQ